MSLETTAEDRQRL